MSRTSERAARRAERSGSGPVRSGAAPARFPGATSAFGLLGEVLLIGLLVTLVALPVVTLPVALAAGVRHLRRFLKAEASSMGAFWADVRAGLAGGIAVGAASVVLVLVLLVDLDLANSGALPGGPLIGAVGWVGLAAAALALFTAAGRWTPARGWRRALRSVPRSVGADPIGAAYLVATAVFAVVVTWQLLPLIVPALGCVALAIVAVPERPRRTPADAASGDA
ncbi:hypothetical protein ACFPER_10545 [Agromyces aurantiacus]|uniref:DUF624 domain-containing protein n=1 Tax=Agromyces aurantiacus TaxID=165814 RepID=A0ABV9R7J5_9MICO|nr:hypothetical protein [Agromyces aurantiacus]MBM7503917.1 hypothetical protein [Agromyces aurantiacus]